MQDYSLARRAMVDNQLRPEAVTDRRVLAAMATVERERFVPESAKALAYFDRPLRLAGGRAMMPPAALGRLLSELAPRTGERALVVGSGTGYAAALLKAIGIDTVALESDEGLARAARDAGVETVVGDLAAGWAKDAPYDQILIDGAVECIPEAIIEQLNDGGRLGTAIIDRGITRLAVGRKAGDAFGTLSIGDAGVPALPGFTRPKAFTF